MRNRKCVSWRRVSTFKQNRSGLGLEAQKEIIRYFVEREGYIPIADYAECYTGKELSGCSELKKAMAHAKKEDAVLVIAKSDRFRNTVEALQIYEEMGDGNIMFCDLPHTDKFTLTLFFALAEREALIVSIRTEQALAVKKAQGYNLGASNEKYKETYNSHTREEKREIEMKRGMTKRLRHQQSREVVAFVKILKQVFPDATKAEEPKDWDWKNINTKNGMKEKILGLMRTMKEIDTSNALFRRWDFDANERYLAGRLCAYIASIRNTFKS